MSGEAFFAVFLVFVLPNLIGLYLLWVRSNRQAHEEKERRLRALKISQVDSMSGPAFEHYVARLLQDRGYSATVTKSSGDFGVDILASRNTTLYAIQCKRQSRNVSRRAVSDAVAGQIHYGRDTAMVVTNAWFTAGARTLARSTGCELVDRSLLTEWILAFQKRAPASGRRG